MRLRRSNDPAYRHGQETLEAQSERSKLLEEIRKLEAEMALVAVLDGPRWRGRKPTHHNGRDNWSTRGNVNHHWKAWD